MDKKLFYILTNKYKDPEGVITDGIRKYLEEKGMECCKSSKVQELKNNRYLYTNADDVPDDTDCIIALGGDGTILQASRDLHHLRIPILGVNIGTFGFLTDADKCTVFEALDKYLNDDFEIDKRMMICGEVIRDGEKVYENFALNDAVINRRGGLKVIDFDISVNNEYINTYFADGVIVSTATGSTAYSLSAGGPIIQPNAKVLIISPICPHTINTRSIVLDEYDEIMIEMTDHKMIGEEREITFDGETSFKLKKGDRIYIRRFPEMALFIKTNRISFLQKIRKSFA